MSEAMPCGRFANELAIIPSIIGGVIFAACKNKAHRIPAEIIEYSPYEGHNDKAHMGAAEVNRLPTQPVIQHQIEAA